MASYNKVPFHFFPLDSLHKSRMEDGEMELGEPGNIGLIVLARNMQILAPRFVEGYPQGIVNLHHSFLPAITGARPYHSALERRAKLAGAMSYYATGNLGDGRIGERDVIRVSHRDRVAELVRKGRDLERLVPARATRWHLNHRVRFCRNNRLVFD